MPRPLAHRPAREGPRSSRTASATEARSSRSSQGGTGKLAPSELARSVLDHLGPFPPDVVVPPRTGVDVGAVRLPGTGQVLLLTTDPVYVDPDLGWEDASWFAFHILASDLSTSGVRPTLITLDLNLPPGTPRSTIERIVRTFSEEARKLRATIVTGHTGRYEGCAFPLVGGSTFAALAPARGYVTSAMARAGDVLLMSGSVALETGVLLARKLPGPAARLLGRTAHRSLSSSLRALTTVPAALSAARAVGLRGRGVHAMHDCTEGGVLTAAMEMTLASGLRLELRGKDLPVLPAVGALCGHFGIEPLSASSEGTLLVSVDARSADRVLSVWARRGIMGCRIGHFGRSRAGGELLLDARRVRSPPPDGFWPAFQRARSRGEGR